MRNDKEFLTWIYARLHYVYKEPANIDYMLRLQAIIDCMGEAVSTPNLAKPHNK